MMPNLPLILASTSPYRRELLSRLHVPFQVVSPQVDETPHGSETPLALAHRLGLEKARAVARLHTGAVVIGSDQVAELDGSALGKPGNHERATLQLRHMSGRRVLFHTSVAVLHVNGGFERALMATVAVQFRRLDEDDIEHYLRAEQPYDCAGSAKCETLGIALLESIESDDPTALVGLPLIRTCELLRQAGIDPFRDSASMSPAPAHASTST